MNPILEAFRDTCTSVIGETSAPADIVRRLAPVMGELTKAADDFLEPAHRRSDPNGYARNLIFATEDDTLSLFSLVWTPGQWTPIHDHGTWGVVGIAEGLLEEQAFMRVDDNAAKPGNTGIELVPGGLVLLPPGAVSTFVPNPDHIHETGVASGRPATLSLHLYGRMLNNFHVYDRQAGTRRLSEAHHEKT
ncbi:MAG: cysteine dioxygenase family protein [Proteobacteria bacterium]|nr:cysteine dioxygenase family protein [Pseudomonadota bacterium]MDA1309764.1 cysteine dioxygenase family protein [Pseudomonadota bacterium]